MKAEVKVVVDTIAKYEQGELFRRIIGDHRGHFFSFETFDEVLIIIVLPKNFGRVIF